MSCQLCGSPAHSGRNHDFRGFLTRLGTADREKLLREVAVTRAPAAPVSGRWIRPSGEGLLVVDPASDQVANHSEPFETSRVDV